MLDGTMRQYIDPRLDQAGQALAARGIGADTITLAGLFAGIWAAICIGGGLNALAMLLIIAGRVADGLDGAVARATQRTDFGGFLDIVCDFAFYGAVPLAFAWRDIDANGLAAAFLLFAFYVNGATFLAYAAIAAKRGLRTERRGVKSIYFTAGLVEGTETIIAFVLMVLLPDAFAAIALVLGVLTLATAVSRATIARRNFRDEL